MAPERNKLCDICSCSVRGILKLLFDLFTDGMVRIFEERNPKIKQLIFVYLLIWLIFNRQKRSDRNTFELCLTRSAPHTWSSPLIQFQGDGLNLISILMTFKYSAVWNYSLFYPKHTFCLLSGCKSQVWWCCSVSSSRSMRLCFLGQLCVFQQGDVSPLLAFGSHSASFRSKRGH